MKPECLWGTFNRTHGKLVMTPANRRNMVVFIDGRLYAGVRSLHLSTAGRRISKLLRLRSDW